MSSQLLGSHSKPHGCENCSRSFATRRALRDHSHSTSHGVVCTTRGCNKMFLSSAALAAHLGSGSHVRTNTSTVNASAASVRMHTAPAPTRNSHTQPSRQLLPCTVSGCTKMFKTARSRAQHLNMAIHGKKMTVVTTQNGVGSVAQPEEPSATDTLESRPSEGSSKSNKGLGIEFGIQHVATVKPMVQSHKHAVRPEKPVNAVGPAQPSMSSPIKATVRVPLFRWDTRWSNVPTSEYATTMKALRALVPTPESWCLTGVDKEFWTPDYKTAPLAEATISTREAIVLDCEMVGTGPKGTISTLARLSAIDFLTGELLIDTLVQPLCVVTDWRTQWSGITSDAMRAAIASGDALKGPTTARTELFNYMDSKTILVGHALQYDLAALGIRHGVTVDSSTLAEAAVGKGVKRRWGLKALCKELLRITVQDNGKDGHDSVEDTLAAREVVLWCLKHKNELKAWGNKKRKEYYAEEKRSKSKLQTKRRAKTPQVAVYEYDSDEYEFWGLSVEELNELCHYPEWYDNWSD